MDAMGESRQPHPPERLVALPSWLLSQAAAQGHRLVSAALASDGLRKHHFTTMLALREGGSSSQAALGRRLGIDRSDLHAVLNDLEREGFVERIRDAEDRRRNMVALTATGTRALERLEARVEAAQDELLAPLTAKQRQELSRWLVRIAEHHAASPAPMIEQPA
jgi:MarR family transcriptional regulator, lower aerobic nicotinate degradation pathway regulator